MTLSRTTYSLTEPCNAAGELHGKARLTKPIGKHQSEWYKLDGKNEIFRCPDMGANTESTHRSRCEKNHLVYKTMQQRFTDKHVFSVDSLADGSKIVITQRHDGDAPLFKVAAYNEGGKLAIRALVRDDGKKGKDPSVLLGVAQLGQQLIYRMDYNPATRITEAYIVFALDGRRRQVCAIRKTDFNPLRNQYGVYSQQDEATGNISQVTFYN